jgi:DNA polymerase-3 subunit epsilon
MKPVLFFDTETNGLPLWNQPSEHPEQPHITQLAAELCDVDTGRVLAYMDMLVEPSDWTIPAELEELTGITNDLARRFGHPIHSALNTFVRMWQMSELRVAHNESFDQRLIRIEALRVFGENTPFHEDWKNGAVFCTQTNSTKILNLPPSAKMVAAGRTHAKSPNLGEAYEYFTGKKLEGAHNAAIDVAACKAVYLGILAYHAAKVA